MLLISTLPVRIARNMASQQSLCKCMCIMLSGRGRVCVCVCVCVQIHLSFSLEMSARDSREAKKATERNAALSMILNLLLSFAAIIGKTKDAELKYVSSMRIYQDLSPYIHIYLLLCMLQ